MDFQACRRLWQRREIGKADAINQRPMEHWIVGWHLTKAWCLLLPKSGCYANHMEMRLMERSFSVIQKIP